MINIEEKTPVLIVLRYNLKASFVRDVPYFPLKSGSTFGACMLHSEMHYGVSGLGPLSSICYRTLYEYKVCGL
jgi:hypothetical protein